MKILMKRIIAVLLVLSAVFVFAACSSGGAKTNDQPSGADSQAQVNNASKVAVFYYTYSDVYISSVRTALDAALTGKGISFQNYDSNSNQTTQNEQIDTAISQGASALVVNIVTAGSVDASQAIVDKAKAADIPVIFFNRALGSDGEDTAVLQSYGKMSFVGTDAPEAGHMQGEMIGEYVVANYDEIDLNKDGNISYAMFKGQEGNVEAIYRTQYSVEDANAILTAAGKPALVYFDSANKDGYQVDLDGNWSSSAANNHMVTNLAQYNEGNHNMIELVICNNDGMAEGAVSALNDKGYNLGAGKDGKTVPVFGVDATDAARQLIADGKMTGTIKQDAEGMADCIALLAENVLSGKAMFDGTDSYNKAADASNKLYIPYAIFR
jgi:methyl-galactoside transport system substrate-binding protein